MNFSTVENSIAEEKKKFKNFLSHFFKNYRILIILFTVSVITAVSLSIWMKSPAYQVLYNQLSNEDGGAIIDELNKMQIPYQFTDVSGQILVPKNKVYEIRLRLAENNLPRNGGVGFELLDKQKFGISQFNEQINYQRALEGELARTIQRINIVKNARVHIALPKSSLFLQDKKESSASIVLDLDIGRKLNIGQINAILHLISSSVSDLPIENITIVDQFGNLLNQSSFFKYNQINELQFKYSEEIESRYRNRIKNILEPLVGVGNVYAQVTAQIDFNDKEKTQEKYSPNTDYKNQAIRSRQMSLHDQIKNQNIKENLSTSFESNNTYKQIPKNKFNTKSINSVKENQPLKQYYSPLNTDIMHDNTINYELNHSVLHTKMNVGEIKRLSAAVVINFIKNKNGKTVPISSHQIKNIENLIREAIGYSKFRGDSIQVINTSFVQNHKNIPLAIKSSNQLKSSILVTLIPWFFAFLLLVFILKKYICPFSKKNTLKQDKIDIKKINIEPSLNKNHLERVHNKENIEKNLNTEKLIHQICKISNQNPRTIALIIRQWMSDKT